MRFVLILHMILASAASHSWLLRRGRHKPTRNEAFMALFGALATLYESASCMKPEWREAWLGRTSEVLPPKFDFGNPIALSAAHDMRYATFLLQRYRWKSLVQPLFAEYDPDSWNHYVVVSSTIAVSLQDIGDEHMERFFEDERDWIQSAIEQFDEARRTRLASERQNAPPARLIAEGTYLPLYIAIQLSDRFIERLRFEAGKIN